MSDKRIDYVIVLDSKIKNSDKLKLVDRMIRHLEQQGLKLRLQYDESRKHIFITLHIPKKVIREFALIYNVKISSIGQHLTMLPSFGNISHHVKIFKTPLSGKDVFSKEGEITNTERILIAHKILNEARFGDGENDYSLEKLIRLGVVETAYPLHDGDFSFDENAIPTNDRQVLLKYWANFSLWYKEQPLNLIEKYFGSEVAFYFAWLGFYNKMLIPAALIGLICSIISIVQLLVVQSERIDDICTSNLTMCPVCRTGDPCLYLPLNISCNYAKISIIFDNKYTVFFAVCMSFWATFFTNLWKRVENALKIQWNVEFQEVDTKFRMEYREKSKHKIWSEAYKKYEPYTPPIEKTFYLFLSYGTCIFLVGIVVLFVFSVILYRVTVLTLMRSSWTLDQQEHATFVLTITSACLQVAFIKLFGKFYAPLSVWLTLLENPRTQTEFDHSIISKRYFLGFANNYASLFYIAFMQERFYSPDEPASVTRFETDHCEPTGCMMPLCVQLCFLMLMKSLMGNIFTLFTPKLTKRLQKKRVDVVNRPQWEKEFELKPSNRYLLTTEFMEMIVQYGFVTFFVAAFPLGPLCALINNCLELRLDAYKLVTRYRRPVPKESSGIGTWNFILRVITHLSVATNAFVLAFTSDFVAREIYERRHNNSLDGYIRSTLSIFDMKDFEGEVAVNKATNSTLCYYKALRYPPDHPQKYHLTNYFWYETGMRLLCVLIFEHIIMITNGIVAYFIPSVPQNVREMLHYERTKDLELKLKMEHQVKNERKTQVKIKRSEARRRNTVVA